MPWYNYVCHSTGHEMAIILHNIFRTQKMYRQGISQFLEKLCFQLGKIIFTKGYDFFPKTKNNNTGILLE